MSEEIKCFEFVDFNTVDKKYLSDKAWYAFDVLYWDSNDFLGNYKATSESGGKIKLMSYGNTWSDAIKMAADYVIGLGHRPKVIYDIG